MRKLIRCAGPITPAAGKRFAGVAYTGALIHPPGWGATIIDTAGLTIPAQVPALDGHENTTAAVVGVVRASVETGQVVFVGTFADTESGQRVQQLLRGDVRLQVSVGVDPETMRELRAGDKVQMNGREIAIEQDTLLVTRGVLKEVSILPLGADDETTIRIAARRGAEHGGTRKMNLREWLKQQGADVAERYATATPARRALLLQAAYEDGAELTRDETGELLKATRMEPRLDSDGDVIRAHAASLVRAGKDRDQVVAVMNLAFENAWSPSRFQSEADLALSPSIDNRPRSGMEANGRRPRSADNDWFGACFMRLAGKPELTAKVYGERVAQHAEDLGLRTMRDLLRAGLVAKHVQAPSDDAGLIRAYAGPSTYDLGTALGSSADKISLDFYQAQMTTWQLFCARVPVTTFRNYSLIRPAWVGAFPVIPPGGELKHITASESVFGVKADTSGVIFCVDRQSIINDDLSLFSRTIQAIARMGAAAVSGAVYTALLGNASDFFGTNNGNYLSGADSALSIEALGLAITKLRKQVGSDGVPCDLQPRTLVVPPELEGAATQILNSTQIARDTGTADQLPQGSPIPRDLKLGVEPRLSATGFHANVSDIGWYLFAAATDACVSVAFLGGRETPVVESVQPPPEVLGLCFRGYFDFGVALSDPKTGVSSAGE